mmetsp:Transcript_12319/g.29316  ORF Transcript_12319/g.29316 Transcript_12319/m.29316 type:complete len:269 (-) Transcript_12319:158-964(-)
MLLMIHSATIVLHHNQFDNHNWNLPLTTIEGVVVKVFVNLFFFFIYKYFPSGQYHWAQSGMPQTCTSQHNHKTFLIDNFQCFHNLSRIDTMFAHILSTQCFFVSCLLFLSLFILFLFEQTIGVISIFSSISKGQANRTTSKNTRRILGLGSHIRVSFTGGPAAAFAIANGRRGHASFFQILHDHVAALDRLNFNGSMRFNIHPIESWWAMKGSFSGWGWYSSFGISRVELLNGRVFCDLLLQGIKGSNGRFWDHGNLLSSFILRLLEQ